MREIFSIIKKPRYAILGFFVGILSFLIFSITPHLGALRELHKLDTSLNTGGSIFNKGVWALLGHTTEPTLFPTILLALLFALIVVMLAFYYKTKGAMLIKTSSTGTFGLLLGVLGVGCSACGTLALTAALGTVGLGSLVLFLPFRGAEFLYIGVFIMGLSIYQLNKLIKQEGVCVVDK